MKQAPRDQFSLMFVYWQNRFTPDLLFGEGVCTRNCKYIKYCKHLHEQKDFSLYTKLDLKIRRSFLPILKFFI